MDEEKAAAYYDELSRKGGGAARFKQGLGFAADSDSNQPKSSSSFLSNFVRASQSQSQSQISHSHSTPTKDKEIDIETERHSQLENVRNKLTKKANNTDRPRVRVRDRDQRDADTRNRTETHKHRGRSRSPERSRRSGGEERDSRRHRSPIKQSSRRSRSRSRERERKGKCNDSKAVDLIPGYHNMSPAERVKANIRLQLSQAAHNDTNTGIGSWERFQFDKDAPLDDAHDLSVAADDDAALVNQFGQTFRFTSLQANREDQIKNAHDQAIFGVPQPNQSCTSPTHDDKFDNTLTDHDHTPTSLMNQKVLSKQQGSWRDRARRNVA